MTDPFYHCPTCGADLEKGGHGPLCQFITEVRELKKEANRNARHERIADYICQDVAELPDRTSPADQPEMMLVTRDELYSIICYALERAA